MKTLPKKWFFFDPSVKESINLFNSCSSKVGIVFFNNKMIKQKNYIKLIKPLIKKCKKKKIKFLIQSSIFWALKFNATGLHIPKFYSKFTKNHHFFSPKSSKNLILCTTCHNKKEILEAKKLKYDFIFLSPAFRTNTHKNFIAHKPINFIKLCYTFSSNVFALGGCTEKNVKRLKNKYLKGFGAITYFKKND